MTIRTDRSFDPLTKSWGYTSICGGDRSWDITRDSAKKRLLKRLRLRCPVLDEDVHSLIFPVERGAE
jgi:hypothetical protein